MHAKQFDLGRFSDPALLILASLVQEPKDAIALCEAIEQTEGWYIEPGSLYRLLVHLERCGWIEALEAEGPLRPYRLTTLGMLVLQRAEASRQGEKLQERSRRDKTQTAFLRLTASLSLNIAMRRNATTIPMERCKNS
jgi:DNA-binding PadR family transcriptional regulator